MRSPTAATVFLSLNFSCCCCCCCSRWLWHVAYLTCKWNLSRRRRRRHSTSLAVKFIWQQSNCFQTVFMGQQSITVNYREISQMKNGFKTKNCAAHWALILPNSKSDDIMLFIKFCIDLNSFIYFFSPPSNCAIKQRAVLGVSNTKNFTELNEYEYLYD